MVPSAARAAALEERDVEHLGADAERGHPEGRPGPRPGRSSPRSDRGTAPARRARRRRARAHGGEDGQVERALRLRRTRPAGRARCRRPCGRAGRSAPQPSIEPIGISISGRSDRAVRPGSRQRWGRPRSPAPAWAARPATGSRGRSAGRRARRRAGRPPRAPRAGRCGRRRPRPRPAPSARPSSSGPACVR